MGVFGSRSDGDGALIHDRRGASRRLTNLRGVVCAPDMEVSCIITELSATGMRLRLDRAVHPGRHVIVVSIDDGLAYCAELIWRKNQEAGLRQLETTSLRGLVPARLTSAREAWLRAGGR